MAELKTLAEIYLPAEQTLINNLFKTIQDTIKEKKKIPFLDSKEDFLEYFIVTDALITFKRQNSKIKKCEITASQLKDAIKYSLRTDEVLTKQFFNKLFGTAIGTPLYSFVNLVADEISNRKVIDHEISHQSFGKGTISKIELQKEFVLFNFIDDCKMLSMAHFSLSDEEGQNIQKLLSVV